MGKKQKQPIALLTSCSVTRNYAPIVRIGDAPTFPYMDDLCEWWVEHMNKVPDEERRTPGELYAGLSFTAITEMAQGIGHDNVYIVTGGLGLGRHTDKIPPYDFTADKNAPHNAHQHISQEKFLPHLWWGKVNMAFRDSPHPVRDLLDRYDMIVGALPKIFIKYIVSDLEQCSVEDRRDRIFIPIPQSMQGSIPAGVRDAFVPYGPEFLANVQYNRVDKAQRVVQKFLKESGGDFVSYASVLRNNAAKGAPHTRVEVDYDTMFEDHPDIVDAPDLGTAIFRAKAHGHKIGGKSRFAGAWRSARGQIEIDADEEELSAAQNALKAIIKQGAAVNEVSDDDIILERIGLFVEALKDTELSGTTFSSKEVCQWAEHMYPNDLRGMDNTNKVSYLLMYNAGFLGLRQIDAGSRKAFTLKE